MTDIVERLKSSTASGEADSKLLGEAVQEISGLRQKCDALEELLIILMRTELPWDDNNNLTDAFPHFKERYLNAMHEASKLLNFDLRSAITRTEPRTM
jgi:hypothetical protein